MLGVLKSERLTVALVGRTNAGKSSLFNLILGQEAAITSPMPGTTTDGVERMMELAPLGPIVLLDTAGFDDASALGAERVRHTQRALARADVILAVGDRADDAELAAWVQAYDKPVVWVAARTVDLTARDRFLAELKASLLEVVPEEALQAPVLFADCVPRGSTVLQVIPIDEQAPKGRLILPQMRVLREALDEGLLSLVVTPRDVTAMLAQQRVAPALAICDSTVVQAVCQALPPSVPLTTYSILMARAKGDLDAFVAGARAIDTLADGDTVLMAESCTHHAGSDDIGRVKIPNGLLHKTGKHLRFSFCSGHDYPTTWTGIRLVIHCGGCMTNRAEILRRTARAQAAGVAVTNYGVCLAYLQGVLPRVLEPFTAEPGATS